MESKKESTLKRLMTYAGKYRYFTYASCILAPIILPDEATASLDVDNESLIQESISKLIENKTVLIIAHRMRTVAGVDKIVVLKDGEAAEMGSPAQLMKKGGIYKHMCETQLKSEKWDCFECY